MIIGISTRIVIVSIIGIVSVDSRVDSRVDISVCSRVVNFVVECFE